MMHKAIIKSNLKKRKTYQIYFEEVRYDDTNKLAAFSIGEGNKETYFVGYDRIIKIVWDNSLLCTKLKQQEKTDIHP